MKPSRTEPFQTNNISLNIRRWGPSSAPPLFLLHGWMDVSASFQWVVEHLSAQWQIIAPDLRGFGDSEWAPQGYYFPDYLSDLDALIHHYAPAEKIHLVGHSMGGNISSLYAGIRPAKIATLVNLEGFGLPPTKPEQAPKRYQQWLDECQSPPVFKEYTDFAELAHKLQKRNPRLDDSKALWLAQQWGHQTEDGVKLKSDPRHKSTNPILYRLEEAKACWQKITAPCLWVAAEQSEHWQWVNSEAIQDRLQCIPQARLHTVADAGHMMHHDQPAITAQLIENFINEHTS